MFQRPIHKPVSRSVAQGFLLGLLVLGSLPFGFAATGARIAVREPEVDSKQVKEGETIQHVFRVVNEGDEPLRIAKVVPG